MTGRVGEHPPPLLVRLLPRLACCLSSRAASARSRSSTSKSSGTAVAAPVLAMPVPRSPARAGSPGRTRGAPQTSEVLAGAVHRRQPPRPRVEASRRGGVRAVGRHCTQRHQPSSLIHRRDLQRLHARPRWRPASSWSWFRYRTSVARRERVTWRAYWPMRPSIRSRSRSAFRAERSRPRRRPPGRGRRRRSLRRLRRRTGSARVHPSGGGRRDQPRSTPRGAAGPAATSSTVRQRGGRAARRPGPRTRPAGSGAGSAGAPPASPARPPATCRPHRVGALISEMSARAAGLSPHHPARPSNPCRPPILREERGKPSWSSRPVSYCSSRSSPAWARSWPDGLR